MFFFSENEKLNIEKKILLLDNQITLRRAYFLALALLYKVCPVWDILVFSVIY